MRKITRAFLVGLLCLVSVVGPAVQAQTPPPQTGIVGGATYRPEQLGLALDQIISKLQVEHEGESLEALFQPLIKKDPRTGVDSLFFKSAPVSVEVFDSAGVPSVSTVQFELLASEAATEVDLQQFVLKARKELGFSGKGLPLDLLVEMRSRWSERVPWLDRWIKKNLSRVSMQTVHTNDSVELKDRRPVGLTIMRVLVNGTPTFLGLTTSIGLIRAATAGYFMVGALSGAIMYFYKEFQILATNQWKSIWYNQIFFAGNGEKKSHIRELIKRIYKSQDWLLRNVDLAKYKNLIPSTQSSAWKKWGVTEFAFASLVSVGLAVIAPEIAAGVPFSDWIHNALGAVALENLFYTGLGLWGQGSWDLAFTHEKNALIVLNDRLLQNREITPEKYEQNKIRIQRRSNLQGALASFASVGALGIGKVVPGMKLPSFAAFAGMGLLGLLHYQRIERRYPWYFEMLKRENADIPLEPMAIEPLPMACGKALGS